MAVSLLQTYKKELGTPVAFDDYREPSMEYYIFPDETFGVYAYQAIPATVDPVTRDAFVNGAMDDLQRVLATNGMQLRYARIAWNETEIPIGPAGRSYYITDLVVGVVVNAASSLNINGRRLVDVMHYVGWFNTLISKLSMPWKTYVLVQKPQTTEAISHRWVWDAVSASYQLSSLVGAPSPPSVEEVKSHFISDGKVDQALGEFVRGMLDNGYQITILRYQVGICYETVRTWQYRDRTYAEYRTHTRLSVEYLSSPELSLDRRISLIAPVVMNLIYAIIAAIVFGAAAFYAIDKLTTKQVITEKFGWVQNPETGEWEWKPVERTTETGPPEWWGYVIPIAIIGVAAVGAVLVIPPIIRAFRPEKE